jgi:hypothetical protein
VRGPGPVQDGLTVQPCRNQLLGPLFILTCRDEQRPRVLGRLEQSRYQDRGPQAQRVGGAFGLEPALEPARYRPVGAPGERCPSSEQVPVQVAGLAPCIEHLIGREPVSGFALGYDCPVKPQPGCQRILAAETSGLTPAGQLSA